MKKVFLFVLFFSFTIGYAQTQRTLSDAKVALLKSMITKKNSIDCVLVNDRDIESLRLRDSVITKLSRAGFKIRDTVDADVNHWFDPSITFLKYPTDTIIIYPHKGDYSGKTTGPVKDTGYAIVIYSQH